MAWVAGADVSTGDLITAAQWNNYLGASGSLEYLKGETDKLDDCSHSEPSRAKDTIYQNTSGKVRFVTIAIEVDGGVAEYAEAEIGSSSPPTITVAPIGHASGVGGDEELSLSFIVPPSWYYRLTESTGTIEIREWHEWDLH